MSVSLPQANNRIVYVESGRWSELHHLCGRDGPFTAMFIIDLRPYFGMGTAPALARAQEVLDYYNASGKKPALRIDTVTQTIIGRTEGPAENLKMVGLTSDQGFTAYVSGVFPWSREIDFEDIEWGGNEDTNYQAFADFLIARGLGDCPIYYDVQGEAILDTSGTPNAEAEGTIKALNISPEAQALGFPDNDLFENFIDWYVPSHRALDAALTNYTRSKGLTGPVIVPNSCSLAIPERNFDAIAQPAADPVSGKVSHAWWTSSGGAYTTRAIACRDAHQTAGLTYWCHFSFIESTAAEISQRIADASPSAGNGAVVLFGNEDPSLLQDIANGEWNMSIPTPTLFLPFPGGTANYTVPAASKVPPLKGEAKTISLQFQSTIDAAAAGALTGFPECRFGTSSADSSYTGTEWAQKNAFVFGLRRRADAFPSTNDLSVNVNGNAYALGKNAAYTTAGTHWDMAVHTITLVYTPDEDDGGNGGTFEFYYDDTLVDSVTDIDTSLPASDYLTPFGIGYTAKGTDASPAVSDPGDDPAMPFVFFNLVVWKGTALNATQVAAIPDGYDGWGSRRISIPLILAALGFNRSGF